MLLSPREFVDLVYPTSPYTHPPYRQSVGLTWMMIRDPSETGFIRLLRRWGGRRLDYVDHDCAPTPEKQGPNRIWTSCLVLLREAEGVEGAIRTRRFFGSIIERGGRFKFISYANDL
jgi:hypothetical protein